MDAIGLKFYYLFVLYGAIVLVSVSFQYASLKGRVGFTVARLGLLGILLFAPWPWTASGLLLGSLLSLFIFAPHPTGLLPLLPPLSIALLVFTIRQVLGETLASLALLPPLLLTGLLAFRARYRFRLPARFYFFFGLFFTIGPLPLSSPTFDLLKGFSILLSFIFAYQTIMVFMATSFVDCKLGEGH